MSKIVERDGFLFVQDDWVTAYMAPFRDRATWPTGVPARHYPELVGQSATYRGEGIYQTESGTRIRLENGGQTQAAWRDEKPAPKPRGKGPWRWACGKWTR